MSRYPPRTVSELNSEEKELHQSAQRMVDSMFGDVFTIKADDGAFVGPFAPLLYTPSIMEAFQDMGTTISKTLKISPAAKETAILGVGSVFQAKYELYAHTRLAQKTALSDKQIDLIKQGKKPEGDDKLDEECEIAFDVSTQLAGKSGPLSDEVWSRANNKFGREQSLALIHLCGYYAHTCFLLNGAAVPVPE